METKIIKSGRVSKSLLLANFALAATYFSWWLNIHHLGNPLLYGSLFLGEVYHVSTAMLFWLTVWPFKSRCRHHQLDQNFNLPWVDVFITVAGEPVEVVRNTISSCLRLRYPKKRIYILNDGFVAKKANWREIEALADDLGVEGITRRAPGGAKAGNINHALNLTKGEIVCIFDADMSPHPDFLEKLIPFFQDPSVGFAQTPQYYKNYRLNGITGPAWEQLELFFGPIMEGKDRYNSAFICGTNFAIRRQALLEVGGMCEDNIAEDFLTSLFVHQQGWKSVYLNEVLTEGLSPEDLLSYYKQQLRWARGSLEVMFGQNPIFKSGLTLLQKLQYLASALYYMNGIIVLIDLIIPLLYLFFGIRPVSASTTSFAIFFLPYMFLTLYSLYLASGRSITFRALAFSQSIFALQLQALWSVLTHRKTAFSVTPKNAREGNFLYLVYPHLLFIILLIIGSGVALKREGLDSSVLTNLAWGTFDSALFIPFIKAAFKWRSLFFWLKEGDVVSVGAGVKR